MQNTENGNSASILFFSRFKNEDQPWGKKWARPMASIKKFKLSKYSHSFHILLPEDKEFKSLY